MEQPRRRMSDAEISPSCLAMHLVNMIDFRDRSACMHNLFELGRLWSPSINCMKDQVNIASSSESTLNSCPCHKSHLNLFSLFDFPEFQIRRRYLSPVQKGKIQEENDYAFLLYVNYHYDQQYPLCRDQPR